MLESLSTTQIALLLMVGVVMLALAVFQRRMTRFLVGGMLFISALGIAIDPNGELPIRQWLFQLQTDRSKVYMGLGALTMAAAVVHLGAWRPSRTSAPSVLMLGIGLYAGLMRLAAGDAEDGMSSVLFALMTILPLIFILPAMLDTELDSIVLLRGMGWAGMGWGACVAVQFVLDWKRLLVQLGLSRFHGLTSNPQHAATYLSVMLIVMLFLSLNDPKIRSRLFWAAGAGAYAIMLLWTGSRTGIGMAALGATAVLYSRAGRAILFLPVAALFAGIALKVLLGSRVEIDIEQFSGRGNTRTAVWRELWRVIEEQPLTGVGVPQGIPSENSLLYGMASAGVGMGILIVVLAIVCAFQCLHLVRSRASLSPLGKRLADLVIGSYAMYFGGSVFEGYIVSRVSPNLVYMLVFSSIGASLLAMSRAAERSHAFAPDAEWDEGDPSWGHSGGPEDEAASAYEARTAG